MTLRDIGSGIMLSSAVAGLMYGLLVKSGFLVGKSEAEQIADARVMSESAERLEFQIEYKLSELRRYEAIPQHERTAADRVQIQELNKQIVWLQGQLRKARGQE